MSLCAYSQLFGKVGEGAHSYRIANIAIIDVIMTIIGAAIISYTMNYKFISVLLILFLLGIVLHRLFCVRTTIDKLLFL